MMRVRQTLLVVAILLGSGLGGCTETLEGRTLILGLPTHYQSTDGETWTEYDALSPFFSVACEADGGYAAAGQQGLIATSPDGVTWDEQTVEDNGEYHTIGYGDGTYVAFGTHNRMYWSDEGSTWHPADPELLAEYRDVIHVDGRFVAVGHNGRIISSEDGRSWTEATVRPDKDLRAVVHADGLFVAVGKEIATSTDADVWDVLHEDLQLRDVIYADGRFLAVGADLATSPDGLDWTLTLDHEANLSSVTQDPDGLLAISEHSGSLWRSDDGDDWSQEQIWPGESPFFIDHYGEDGAN